MINHLGLAVLSGVMAVCAFAASASYGQASPDYHVSSSA